jgi:hypothetical protein
MPKYLLAYRGGAMAETPEAQEAVMAAWGAWFGSLGEAVVDGGAPFSVSATVGAGASDTGTSGLGGYSVLQADSLDAAIKLTDGCPILAEGGSVEVYEGIDVG